MKTKKMRFASIVGFIALAAMIGFGFISCSDPNKCNKKCLKIGDTGPGGGIIFHHSHVGELKSSGEKVYYLEAAPEDQGIFTWRPKEKTYLRSDKWGKGDPLGGTVLGFFGKEDTAKILAKIPNAQAAKACADYRGGGLDDWFLPNKNELNKMYEQRKILGMKEDGLTGDLGHKSAYWSSSADDGDEWYEPWYQVFSNVSGSQKKDYGIGGYGMTEKFYVRAIRAF